MKAAQKPFSQELVQELQEFLLEAQSLTCVSVEERGTVRSKTGLGSSQVETVYESGLMETSQAGEVWLEFRRGQWNYTEIRSDGASSLARLITVYLRRQTCFEMHYNGHLVADYVELEPIRALLAQVMRKISTTNASVERFTDPQSKLMFRSRQEGNMQLFGGQYSVHSIEAQNKTLFKGFYHGGIIM